MKLSVECTQQLLLRATTLPNFFVLCSRMPLSPPVHRCSSSTCTAYLELGNLNSLATVTPTGCPTITADSERRSTLPQTERGRPPGGDCDRSGRAVGSQLCSESGSRRHRDYSRSLIRQLLSIAAAILKAHSFFILRVPVAEDVWIPHSTHAPIAPFPHSPSAPFRVVESVKLMIMLGRSDSDPEEAAWSKERTTAPNHEEVVAGAHGGGSSMQSAQPRSAPPPRTRSQIYTLVIYRPRGSICSCLLPLAPARRLYAAGTMRQPSQGLTCCGLLTL
eukprot:924241-Rhodomonas_salina.2